MYIIKIIVTLFIMMKGFLSYTHTLQHHFQQNLSGPVSVKIDILHQIFCGTNTKFHRLFLPASAPRLHDLFSLIANMLRKRRTACIPPQWNRWGESCVFLDAQAVASLHSLILILKFLHWNQLELHFAGRSHQRAEMEQNLGSLMVQWKWRASRAVLITLPTMR